MLESIIHVICDSEGWSGTLAAASADCCNSKITLRLGWWWKKPLRPVGIPNVSGITDKHGTIIYVRYAAGLQLLNAQQLATFECTTAGNWRTRLVP
jgi:hypothetical protein